MAVIVGNSVNSRPGQPSFDLLSNLCDYFEIGMREGDDVWLEGQIVGPEGEFVFNGRLFAADGGAGTVIDNFPKGALPNSWTKTPNIETDGYALLDHAGETVFSYSVVGTVCHVTVGLHHADGKIAAVPGQGGLVTNQVRVRIGRSGIAIG